MSSCDASKSWGNVFHGWIYTRDGLSIWDKLGHIRLARLIICLCIKYGETDGSSDQMNYPWKFICQDKLHPAIVHLYGWSVCFAMFIHSPIIRWSTLLCLSLSQVVHPSLAKANMSNVESFTTCTILNFSEHFPWMSALPGAWFQSRMKCLQEKPLKTGMHSVASKEMIRKEWSIWFLHTG